MREVVRKSRTERLSIAERRITSLNRIRMWSLIKRNLTTNKKEVRP